MPTGYTAKLMEEGQSFDDFVKTCARAMGALIMMRDDPMDRPIPERFEPSDWSAQRLEEAKALAVRLEEMGGNERIAFGERKREEEISSARSYLARETAENERLVAMREQVAAWEPPSADHVGFKEFMLEQIKISMHSTEYFRKSLREAEAKAPVAYYAEAVMGAQRDIVYHKKNQAEEVARTDARNRWIADLRRSLRESVPQ